MEGIQHPFSPPRFCVHTKQQLITPIGEIMKNVEIKVEGNILTIKVDLSKEF